MSTQNLYDGRSVGDDDDLDRHKTNQQTKVLSRTTISNFGKTRTNSAGKIDHAKDKELINSGLHKLVSTFNSTARNQKSQKQAAAKKIESKLPISISNQIAEKPVESHIVLKKQVSIDKYTMTDFDVENTRKLQLEPAILEDQPYRDLQWTDPRLIKKYAMVKHPYRKSLTIPYVTKSDCNVETLDENCHEEAEVITPDNKHIIFKCLYYFCTASVSFIGAMCGITLITVILWKLLDEHVLHYQLESPKPDLFFTRHLTNLVGSLVYMLNAVGGYFVRFLTMSSSEAFAIDEEPSAWYKLY